MGILTEIISVHILVQSEPTQDSGNNLGWSNMCFIGSQTPGPASLPEVPIPHLTMLGLAWLLSVGLFSNLLLLQLQEPSDNHAHLQIWVFGPSICEVANCRLWAFLSPRIYLHRLPCHFFAVNQKSPGSSSPQAGPRLSSQCYVLTENWVQGYI